MQNDTLPRLEGFLTGCRYWPRAKGPFFFAGGVGSWELSLWDLGEVRDELNHIADIGFDFVRIALPWEAVQPSATRLRPALLNRLELLLDAVEAAGLSLQLTLAGQLGGTLFVPYWLLATTPEMALRSGAKDFLMQKRVITEDWVSPWPLGNLYEQSTLMAGQRFFWREITRHFAAHPALTELDLSAGGLLSTIPPRNPEMAFRWWEALAESAREEGEMSLLYSDASALLMQSSNHLPRLHEWHATVGKLSIATTLMDDGTKRTVDQRWPLFQMQLAHTLAHAPVGCISLGVPTSQAGQRHVDLDDSYPEQNATKATANPIRQSLYTEEEQARFFHDTLPALYHIGVPTICHTTWADAPPHLHLTPPYDQNIPLRHGGLLRADGREKEAASVWRSFHAERANRSAPSSIRTLEIDQDEWYQRRYEADFMTTLYQKYQYGEI